jgi:thiol-disulfide isomerase/thioredoxin
MAWALIPDRLGVRGTERVGSDPLQPHFSQEFAPMRKMFLSLAALALIASPVFAGRYNKVVSVGEKAPTFSGIPATTKAGDDTSLSLGDIKEDVVVLVFLANHCPVVQAYEDRIIDFTNDYKGKSVKVVGVAVSNQEIDRLPGIKNYMKEKGSNYLYGYDESQQIGKAYGATNTPQFFVLDKDRVIRYMGALDDNMSEAKVQKTYLRDAVDAVLKGDSPEVSETQPKGCGVSYNKK